MSSLIRAAGCAIDSILWVACVAALIILIGVPVVGFWQAEGEYGGPLVALGVLALLVGSPQWRINARREFSKLMKAAGWKRLPAGGFGWIHEESGTTWEGENYTADQGIAWEWYHGRGETPPATGGAKL